MTTTHPRRLVIVESPTKARTIVGYLGAGYDVEASVGHIRDLPQPSELPADMKKGPYSKFAVDVDNGFDPYYRVDPAKKKKVTELKKLLKQADELYLATDEDREGEAIAWHLIEVLQPTIPVKRMVFHEITPEAISRALENTRDLDSDLVDAQETRRILDRLYGYEVSPVLWRKVRAGLSAGRVQSVATRLVVERERERMKFVPADYWDLDVTLKTPEAASAEAFPARLTTYLGQKVATGKDFDDLGNVKPGAQVVVLNESQAEVLATALQTAPVAVAGVETKPYSRKPAAPFTTSTLQQEAGRKLRMSSRQAMRVAQSLYENGYITYMRTDSSALSAEAVAAARSQVTELYGPEYVPASPRVYAKKQKAAQEAHEAIRPAGDSFRTPAQVQGKLGADEFKLYDLIWKRTVASQMADAKGSTATMKITADVSETLGGGAAGGEPRGGADSTVGLTASGTVITFRGFLAAYEEGRDASRYDSGDAGSRLPAVKQGDPLEVENARAAGHTTAPPPRYTEASLVKQLEELGIGRPSTYAAIISTIQDRGYVSTRGNALVPSWLAFSVVRLLEEYFAGLVDYQFTADLETELDHIAAGELDRTQWLSEFYFGSNGAGGAGAMAGAAGGASAAGTHAGLKPTVDGVGDIDARDINTVTIADGVELRVGRYGPYLEVAGEDPEKPTRVSIPEDLAPDELTADKARELIANQGDGDRELGVDPDTGHTIIAKNGRFGPYVTEVMPESGEPAKRGAKKAKPRTASLFKSMDIQTVALPEALKLLSLPRVVGQDQEGTEITAQNGRYGPYLKKGTDSRSLESEDQIFSITLEEALEIYAQPKTRGGRKAAAALKELGMDPVSEKPVVVKDGRFGPYVTDGTTNATLRKDDSVESITPERAFELLAEKRAKGPVKRTGGARKSGGKTTATKTSASKAGTKSGKAGGTTSGAKAGTKSGARASSRSTGKPTTP